jgi:hypothetical protein
LADQAFRQNPKLSTTMEVLPFIEGYARSGELDKARQLTERVWEARPDGRKMTEDLVCSTWKRIEGTQGDNPALANFAAGVLTSLGCE